jgi:HAD superfamily hydrolase (TIGR01509 family)
MIQALIFDFDGLILDTEVPDYQSWLEVYQEYGCQLPFSTWASYIGGAAEVFDVYAHLETQLGCTIDRQMIRTKRRKRYSELVEAQPVLPGILDYVTTAKRLGLKLAVASSGTREWVVGHLTRLALLDYFDCVKCFDDVQCGKPDPASYLAALSTLQVDAKRAIAFEDSPNGILAAHRAGLFCVAIPNPLTYQLSLEHADMRLKALSDLPLEQLLSHFSGPSTL